MKQSLEPPFVEPDLFPEQEYPSPEDEGAQRSQVPSSGESVLPY
jgi:hypothetical protein